jgi:hypothetical protein
MMKVKEPRTRKAAAIALLGWSTKGKEEVKLSEQET